MGVVDTILVGRLGSIELAAVGAGSAIYFAYMVFGYGTLSAITATVAQASGARDDEEVSRTLTQGLWLAVLLAITAVIYISNSEAILRLLEQPSEIIAPTESYLSGLRWGILGTMLNAVCRTFSLGLGQTRVPMIVSIGGAIANAGLAALFIFGGLGVPAMGVLGAGYATAIVHWLMFASMLTFLLRAKHFAPYRARFSAALDVARIVRLVKLGVPIGVGSSLEMGVFGFTTLMMGRIGTTAVAAHQVAISVASFTFMIPMGIGIATTTRVGHAIGAGRIADAARSGWTGIATGMMFMVLAALTFLVFRDQIVAIYTTDADVAARAAVLLMIAGAFQLGDGLQVTAQGALRGLKDTARPMLVNLLAYWVVGFPMGLLFAFELGMDAPGLWWGLTLGLTTAGVLHALRFRKLTRT